MHTQDPLTTNDIEGQVQRDQYLQTEKTRRVVRRRNAVLSNKLTLFSTLADSVSILSQASRDREKDYVINV